MKYDMTIHKLIPGYRKTDYHIPVNVTIHNKVTYTKILHYDNIYNKQTVKLPRKDNTQN